MSLVYEVMYLIGFKPWDSGVPPPELVAAVEGSAALPPARALDLGGGTGTSAIYLARHGWEVTANDPILDDKPQKIAMNVFTLLEIDGRWRVHQVGEMLPPQELGLEPYSW